MSPSQILLAIFPISVLLSRCGVTESATVGVESLFAEIGFSPACVATTLALCESSPGTSSSLGLLQKAMKNLKKEQRRPRNCADLLKQGDTESGVRTVYPFSCCPDRPVSAMCDQGSDGGGWTVIQHREDLPLRENFFRKWVEYQLGFGNLTGEFWMGLENIRALVSHTLMELRVDLEDFEGQKRWAKYEHFHVGDAADKYRLDLGDCSGDAGDALTYHSGKQFSTKEQDNDASDSENCAEKYRGAWWYFKCHHSNLNGYQDTGNHTSYGEGINWHYFRGSQYSLKTTTLSLRPAFKN